MRNSDQLTNSNAKKNINPYLRVRVYGYYLLALLRPLTVLLLLLGSADFWTQTQVPEI